LGVFSVSFLERGKYTLIDRVSLLGLSNCNLDLNNKCKRRDGHVLVGVMSVTNVAVDLHPHSLADH
jgi:hypothetical protein